MTEQEWLECTDPEPMMTFLHSNVSDRKLRLFACASVRQLWHLLADERSRKAVEISESFADGLVSEGDLASAREEAVRAAVVNSGYSAYAAFDAAEAKGGADRLRMAAHTAVYVWEWEVNDDGSVQQTESLNQHSERRSEAQRAIQCHILRDVLGNPFHPITVNPAWLAWNDGTVRKIAQSIYEERAFDRLPILADALTDAVCDNADLLNHCRSEGPHVKGCWAVDLLLGKE